MKQKVPLNLVLRPKHPSVRSETSRGRVSQRLRIDPAERPHPSPRNKRAVRPRNVYARRLFDFSDILLPRHGEANARARWNCLLTRRSHVRLMTFAEVDWYGRLLLQLGSVSRTDGAELILLFNQPRRRGRVAGGCSARDGDWASLLLTDWLRSRYPFEECSFGLVSRSRIAIREPRFSLRAIRAPDTSNGIRVLPQTCSLSRKMIL